MLTILYSCTVGYHLKEVQVGAHHTVQLYSRLSSKVGAVGAHHIVQLYSRLSTKVGAGRCSSYCTAVQ